MVKSILNLFLKNWFIITICVFLLLLFVAGLIVYQQTEFSRLKEKRESIDDLIYNGTLHVQDNGLITLPETLKNLSHTGECVLVKFDENTAIYFYEYRGILEESRGVLYITNLISYEDYANADRFPGDLDCTEVFELEPNWYSCRTG